MCDKLIQEYRIWLQELLTILHVICEDVVPAGRIDEDVYWGTKALREEIKGLNAEETNRKLQQYAAEGRALLQSITEILVLENTENSRVSEGNWISEENRIRLRRSYAKAILNSLQMLANGAYFAKQYLYELEGTKQCAEYNIYDVLCNYFEIDSKEEVKRIRSGVVVQRKQIAIVKSEAKTYYFHGKKSGNWKKSVAG